MVEQENDVSWALKILEREPDYEQNLIAKYFHSLYLGLMGGCVPVLKNAVYKRPLWSGFQHHIMFTAGGMALGAYLRHREDGIVARRDAVTRDYIMRHPEDFPPPDRKKYGEVFYPWVPMR
ncbi:hypothetical protein PV327_003607 [Microctonus hyperodae]|uniref:NADH dehydrogenase [ubiquinone] 1 subunit C2 n=1 Tax=Microctonus hyperodae TaxID=165561 RepID=A0AA39L175_MICHY|nr:hypothetical protein PV327_003607 [Microctonus hyperodae]